MEGKENRVHTALREKGMAAGIALQIGHPELVEMAGWAGFDFAYFDGEHGAFGMETTVNMIRAADVSGLCPVVRVATDDRATIGRMLDAGALGIIVPNVRTAEQAAACVAATRYEERGEGTRGACPGSRATRHQVRDWPAYVRWAHDTIMMWLIIESEEAVANIDAIAAVPGVGALMLGPYDLAQTMGFPGQPHHPEVSAALAKVVDAAQRHGVEVVVSLFKAEAADMAIEKDEWIARGGRILVSGSEKRMLMAAFRDRVSGLHQPGTAKAA